MSIYEVLTSTGLPCAYSHFRTNQEPPYIVYIGNGQDTMSADDTIYWKNNRYQIEYYFTKKEEAKEEAIEQALLDAGLQYEKSEDVFIDDQNVFLIYYYI